jgi:hypothetical protein
MPITNDWDMYNVVSKVMVKVIEDVTNLMMIELEDSIEKNTYKFDYYPNKIYYNGRKTPTRQFEHAFHFDGITNNLKEVFTELSYHWEEMDFDADTLLHGSDLYGDVREKLAEILNVDGLAGMKERQPYWDIFIDDMFQNGKLKRAFDQAMKVEFAKIGAIVN